MANEYQGDDERQMTRGEAREHRRELGGMVDELRAGLAAIKNVVHIINRIKVGNRSITFQLEDE